MFHCCSLLFIVVYCCLLFFIVFYCCLLLFIGSVIDEVLLVPADVIAAAVVVTGWCLGEVVVQLLSINCLIAAKLITYFCCVSLVLLFLC